MYETDCATSVSAFSEAAGLKVTDVMSSGFGSPRR